MTQTTEKKTAKLVLTNTSSRNAITFYSDVNGEFLSVVDNSTPETLSQDVARLCPGFTVDQQMVTSNLGGEEFVFLREVFVPKDKQALVKSETVYVATAIYAALSGNEAPLDQIRWPTETEGREIEPTLRRVMQAVAIATISSSVHVFQGINPVVEARLVVQEHDVKGEEITLLIKPLEGLVTLKPSDNTSDSAVPQVPTPAVEKATRKKKTTTVKEAITGGVKQRRTTKTTKTTVN